MTGAALALCHFCDNHGAVVVLTTQSFKKTEKDLLLKREPMAERDFSTRLESNNKQRCESCHCFPADKRYLVTEDEGSGDFYLSCNNDAICSPDLTSSLKSATTRCLSLEVSPQKNMPKKGEAVSETRNSQTTEPIIFKNFDDTSVLCTNFSLKDSEFSRGFTRHYGLILTLNSRNLLMRVSGRVTTLLQDLAAKIQPMALANFHPSPTTLAKIDYVRRMAIYTPPRNLAEFTDPDVYAVIHYRFVEILQLVLNSSSEETFYLGPPVGRKTFLPKPDYLSYFRSKLSRQKLRSILAAVFTGRKVELCCQTEEEVLELVNAIKSISYDDWPVWHPPKWISLKSRWSSSCSGKSNSFLFVMDDASEISNRMSAKLVETILDVVYGDITLLGGEVAELYLANNLEKWRSLSRIYRRCLDMKHMDREAFRRKSHLMECDMLVLDVLKDSI